MLFDMEKYSVLDVEKYWNWFFRGGREGLTQSQIARFSFILIIEHSFSLIRILMKAYFFVYQLCMK